MDELIVKSLKHIYVDFCQVFYLKSKKNRQVIITIRVLPFLQMKDIQMNDFLNYIFNSDNVACTAVTDLGRTEEWN